MKRNQKRIIAAATALSLAGGISIQMPANYLNIFAEESISSENINIDSNDQNTELIDSEKETVEFVREADYTFSNGTLTVKNTDPNGNKTDKAASIGLNLNSSFKHKVKNIIIEPGITTIEKFCFYEFDNLDTVIIPSTVNGIGEAAFKKCKIKNITIPENVKYIKRSAFEFATINNLTIEAACIIEPYAFSYTKITDNFTIKNVENIMPYAFFVSEFKDLDLTYCENTIYNKLAFSSCHKLEHLILPINNDRFGTDVFSFCDSLTEVEYDSDFYTEKIPENCFCQCENLKSMHSKNDSSAEPDTIYIPESVRTIEKDAFSYCLNIENVIIDGRLESIEECAFMACRNLKKIIIPDYVTYIAPDAFYGCNNLTIYGDTDTYAEEYAKEHNIPFVELIYDWDTDENTSSDAGDLKKTANEDTLNESSNEKHNDTEIDVTTSTAKESASVSEDITSESNQNNSENTDIKPAEFIYGDLNGDGVADLTDATLLSVYLMTKEQAKIKFLMAGDVDGNGIVDIADLPKFKQYITKDAAVPFLGPDLI